MTAHRSLDGSPPRIAHRLGDVEARFVGRGAPSDVERAMAPVLPSSVTCAWLRQVHGAEVHEASPGEVGDGDALWTDTTGLAVVVVTADCVPVLLTDGTRVSAVHAGWRGIVQQVVPAAVARMRATGAGQEISAWIGPAIGACCYEVSDEVGAQVVAASDSSIARPGPRGRPMLDLTAAVRRQLTSIDAQVAEAASICTRCDADWCSYRRDGPMAGRNYAVAWRRA